MSFPVEALTSGGAALCVKNLAGMVLYQNDACRDLCGEQVCAVCEKNCMQLYRRQPEAPRREEGTQYFPNQKIEDRSFDVILINNGSYLNTILYPLERKRRADVDYLARWGLSRREKEIALLAIEGLTNEQIAKRLFVCLATVKTHLNNIYKKLPEHQLASWRDGGSQAPES